MTTAELSVADPTFAPVQDDTLGPQDRTILDLEKQRWRFAGSKETAIREQLGLSATRYYQTLNVLIDNPAALVAEPVLVHRLRRQREHLRRARTA